MDEKRTNKQAQKTIQDVNEKDPFELIEEISEKNYLLENQLTEFKKDKHIFEAYPELLQKIEAKYKGEVPAGMMTTGFPTINRSTGGIMETDLIGIYGKDKQGKTTLSDAIMLDVCFQGEPVFMFSREMDFEQVALKSLALGTNTDYLSLRNPRGQEVCEQDLIKFNQCVIKKFKDTQFFIDDYTKDVDKIINKIKQLKRKLGIKLFCIDYLQLLRGKKKFERNDLELESHSYAFKDLAKEIRTPIILISQANEDRQTSGSKGLLRACDFAFYIEKPSRLGIKSIMNKFNEAFLFNESHFLVTVERSRHGLDGQNFVCGYAENSFVEIDINNIFN
jgi:replicative DNA helicase